MQGVKAYICLGSNTDDAQLHLENALVHIAQYPKTRIHALSRVYKTEPQEDKNQNWFYNQMLCLEYNESFPDRNAQSEALGLLDFMLKIEQTLGRVRDDSRRFGPRSIDLDIITFGTYCINTEKLIIPHPRFSQRAFVLIPLQEIADDTILAEGKTAQDFLDALQYTLDEDRIFQ